MKYPSGYLEKFKPNPAIHETPEQLKACPVCTPRPPAPVPEAPDDRRLGETEEQYEVRRAVVSDRLERFRTVAFEGCTTSVPSEFERVMRRRRR